MEKEEEKKDDLGFILFSRAFFALGLCQGNMYKGKCQISFTLFLLQLFFHCSIFLRLYRACLRSTLSGLCRMEVILMVYIQQGNWCS